MKAALPLAFSLTLAAVLATPLPAPAQDAALPPAAVTPSPEVTAAPADASSPTPAAPPEDAPPDRGPTPLPLASPSPTPSPSPSPSPEPPPTTVLPALPTGTLAPVVVPGAPAPEGGAFRGREDGPGGRVARERLDQDQPVVVKLGTEDDTFLSFPKPIEAFYGRGFARKAEERAAGRFFLSYREGKSYCALRALKGDVTGQLTVVLDGRGYTLVCQAVDESERKFSVLFTEGGTLPDGEPAAKPATLTPPPLPYKKASIGRINGLVDKVKAYPTFREANPEIYTGLEVAEPHTAAEVPGVRAEIRRVVRENAIDTVVFEVGLTNLAEALYRYDPASFTVRVGDELYRNSFADASGIIGPRQTTTAYFAVTGSGDGTRNDLSVKNEFLIGFNKIIEGPAVATTTTTRRTTTTTTRSRHPDRSK